MAVKTQSPLKSVMAGDVDKLTDKQVKSALTETVGKLTRVAELFSLDGRPFEVQLRWSAGSGSGAWSKLTLAHTTRVCLFARAMALRVSKLAIIMNRRGPLPTHPELSDKLLAAVGET